MSIEKSARRVSSDQLDYYIYVEYLSPEIIDLLVGVEIDSQHLSMMYVFKDCQLSRSEYVERFGHDIPLNLYKMPSEYEDWKSLSLGDKSKITFIKVATEGSGEQSSCQGPDSSDVFKNFFKAQVNELQ